jgi:cytochrome c553
MKSKKYRTTLVLILLAVLVIVLPAFAGGNNKKETKVAYEFPPEMAPAVRDQFIKECDKGQALYNMTCAACHNQKIDGKQIIPDWTSAQLVGYELRVLNPKHEGGIPEEHVTAEELGQIMTFLTFKKKNVAVGK